MKNNNLSDGIATTAQKTAVPGTPGYLKFVIGVTLMAATATGWAKGEVSAVSVSEEDATLLEYTVGEQTIFWGQGKDKHLDYLVYNGANYTWKKLADSVSIRRVDNEVAQGEPCSVFAEKAASGDFSVDPSYPGDANTCSMETVMSGRIINRGALDVFSNVNDVIKNAKNIERIDFLFPAGIKTPSQHANLEKFGHIVTEKGANNPVQIAAILSVDGNGVPASFGPLVKVQGAGECAGSGICYGAVNDASTGDLISVPRIFFHNDSSDTAKQGYPHKVAEATEQVGVAYVSLADLGVPAASRYYGFAYFANDVTSGMDLTAPDTFPKNTTDNSNGDGADIYGGTAALFVKDGVNDISGHVIKDVNSNGSVDAGEGLAGISVNLMSGESVVATTETTSDGSFEFIGVDAGSYTVVVDQTDADLPATGFALAAGADAIVADVTTGNMSGIVIAFEPTEVVPPVNANDDTATTNAGTPVNVNVLTNDDIGPGVDTLTLGTCAGSQSITTAAGSTATVTDAGLVTFTPAAGFIGTDTVDYCVTDTDGNTSEGTLTVTVTADPAVAANDTATTKQNTAVSKDVIANDDLGQGLGSVRIVTGPANGTATITDTGIVTYTPVADFVGTDRVVYEITDTQNNTSRGVLTITVTQDDDVLASGGAACSGNDCLPATGLDGNGAGAGSFSWLLLMLPALTGLRRRFARKS